MDTGLRFIALVDIALRGHTAFRQGKMLELHRRTSVVGKITGIVGTAVPFGETRGKKSEERCREARDRSAAFSNYISSSFCGIMTRLTSVMVKSYNYSAPSSTVFVKHQLAQKYPSRLKTAALI